VHGIISEAPESIPKGVHHTLNISLNEPIKILKKEWASYHMRKLKRASQSPKKPVIIVSIDDERLAIAITAQYGVKVKVENSVKLPGKFEVDKRKGAVIHFFKQASTFLQRIWSRIKGPIVIIGVGFVKNDFVKYLQHQVPDVSKSITDVKSVNNTGLAGIYEALRSGVLVKTLRRQRIIQETQAIEEVLKRLGKNRSDVAYGVKAVTKAANFGAIDELLLADVALREVSNDERRLMENLMNIVESKGGKTMILSTEQEAGHKLLSLGGVAALLRFSLT
jgi:protein pelota